MTEDNAKKDSKINIRSRVSVKVYEDTRDLMERHKMRFKSKDRPDYADIVEPAITEYLAKHGTAEKSKVTPIRDAALDDTHRKLLEFFDRAAKSGATAGDVAIAGAVLNYLGISMHGTRKKVTK